MHEQLIVGNVMAYRIGRHVVVEARGRCAFVPGWSMSPRSSVAERPPCKRDDGGSNPSAGSNGRVSWIGDTRVEESCGNVFEDLGLPDADELLARAERALRRIRASSRNRND